ncbi:MAG: lipid A-modifier LpxR family protein, partial [Pseudomonadota bacterium]
MAKLPMPLGCRLTIGQTQTDSFDQRLAPKLAALFACVLALLAATPSMAKPNVAENGSFSIVNENDFYADGGPDEDYSNGLEISFLGAPSRAPGWTPPLVKLLTDPTDTVSTRLHFAVGHQIYTPEDISLEVPDPDDRPYAGLLYGSVGTVINTNDRRFDQIQGLFGVVGPASQADSLQLLWHDVIQAQRPNGWETQISNRVVG